MSEAELQDSILRNALALQRLSAFEQAEAEAILRELERDLRTLLASRDLSSAGRREVASLISEAEIAIAGRYGSIAGALDTRGLMILVADRTVQTLKIIAPRIAQVTPERLASLAKKVLIDGSPAKAWWDKQAEELQFKFAAQVRQGVVNNETIERIVGRIVGRGDEPGIMITARRNARTLVHSSVMTAANDARLATFRKNAKHVAGVRWLATLDSRTCAQCAALDGQMWDLDGEKMKGTSVDFISPPAHFSCRCVLSPVPKSLDAILGTEGLDEQQEGLSRRASKDGPIGGATTFQDFLKRQSPEFIENMLGKGRAELFLAGKITVRDLVSGTGRELSLADLP